MPGQTTRTNTFMPQSHVFKSYRLCTIKKNLSNYILQVCHTTRHSVHGRLKNGQQQHEHCTPHLSQNVGSEYVAESVPVYLTRFYYIGRDRGRRRRGSRKGREHSTDECLTVYDIIITQGDSLTLQRTDTELMAKSILTARFIIIHGLSAITFVLHLEKANTLLTKNAIRKQSCIAVGRRATYSAGAQCSGA